MSSGHITPGWLPWRLETMPNSTCKRLRRRRIWASSHLWMSSRKGTHILRLRTTCKTPLPAWNWRCWPSPAEHGACPVDGETALAWADYLAQGWEGGIAAWQIQLDEAYAYAIDHKLELAMARKQLEMAESAYKAVKDERDWTVTLAGQYQPDDEVIFEVLNRFQLRPDGGRH